VVPALRFNDNNQKSFSRFVCTASASSGKSWLLFIATVYLHLLYTVTNGLFVEFTVFVQNLTSGLALIGRPTNLLTLIGW